MSGPRACGLLVSFVLILVLAGVPAAQAGPLYGATGASGQPSNLVILNPQTGAVVQTVGPIGFSVSGLAFSPVDGQLYGVTRRVGTGSPSSLLRIDLTTGRGTVVGGLGLGAQGIADLAFDQGGRLFGWVEPGSDDLARINPATGLATRVGEAGLTTQGSGLAFDVANNRLLLAGGASGGLFAVNPDTGAARLLATLTGAPLPNGVISGLGFDDETGALFGVNLARLGRGNVGQAFLVGIDPQTGRVTNRGPSVAGLNALAFQVPEPTTFALLGVGLGALVLRRRWWGCPAA